MNILSEWMERDLTAAIKAGDLPAAFEVDEQVHELAGMLDAGRFPILTGESGTGKTAIVYELIRRSAAGDGCACLAGRRVLQISIQRRAAALEDAYEVSAELQKLADVLAKAAGKFALFIRDIHLGYQYDLEAQLSALAYTFEGPVIGEGRTAPVEAMLEHDDSLQQHYSIVNVEEPSLERARQILNAWALTRQDRNGQALTATAIEQALTLTHRFLARSRLPRKAIDLLTQTASRADLEATVSSANVIECFCATHRVPRALLDPTVPLDLVALQRRFEGHVLGQKEAVRAAVDVIGTVKAGLSDERRPFGAFLFVGPTGVGRTHVAQLLAECLFGHKERLVRLNMADMQGDYDAFTLFGYPNGDNAAEKRGMLTLRLMGKSFAVVLLDEFEKAHPTVHDRFLQLMDEGAFINGAGETVSCRSLILIATSNAGADAHRGEAMGFASGHPERRESGARTALGKQFRTELLNRFDRIVHFMPLRRRDIRTIAVRELERLVQRSGFKHRRLTLVVDGKVIDWITRRGYDPQFGARELRRTIERNVTTAVADVIVRENPEPGSRVKLTVRDGWIVASVAPAASTGQRTASVSSPDAGAAPIDTRPAALSGRNGRQRVSPFGQRDGVRRS